MKIITGILFLLIFTNLYSQDNRSGLFSINREKTDNSQADFKKSVDGGIIVNIDRDIYTDISEKKELRISLDMPIEINRSVNIKLERFEILSPDAKFYERTADGNKETDLRNLILSYKGTVTGDENSLVTLNFFNGKILGLIISGKDTYVIGSLTDVNKNETEDYIIYNERNLKHQNDFRCGSDAFGVPEEITRRIHDIYGKQSDAGTATLIDAKIAIDVDFFTYNIFGSSVANASAYALALTSAASAVYAKDMNIKLTVGYLRVWTTQDPYTATNGSTLLNQFQSDWINTQGSVQRVVAHLISRRTSIDVGGIAYLNTLCSYTYGYGLSAVLGIINNLPAYSYDVEVIAHELGHNFGSPHTHACSWVGGPIDTCYYVEGGCYSGPLHPTEGTIMSYCDTEGGTVRMDFGPQPEALIRNTAEAASCIPASERPVFTAYPNGGETFRTLTQTKIFWGTSLTGNVNLEYSSDNGNSWNTIQNNVSAQLREYQWTIPYIGYTNQAKVRILNSSNSSEGDTSDASFRIILNYNTFVQLTPPSTTRIETSVNGTSVQQFVWQSSGTHPSLRYKLKFRKIGTSTDYLYTSDNNGADTVISFRNSQLDSLAQRLGTTNDSVRCSWRAWTYNGYDSASSAGLFLVTFVRTNVGINIISSIVPEKFSLENNFPNPFNPETRIKFDVAKSQNIKVTVFDAVGRETEVLVNEILSPGKYEVTFNASDYPSGVYFYKMQTADFVQTRRMVLLK
ncbi:MAG: T9SS type A sorting domain-containing protein [Ignavibacteria bacterium]|nr:T9SS type A sorting domain-containing protein [Ignavibacteria bacterium]